MATANLVVPYLEPAEFALIAARAAGGNIAAAWWKEMPLGTPGTVTAIARVEASQHAEWGRRLSEECGGFCLSRIDEISPPAVFFAGFTLGTARDQKWEESFEQVCGLPWPMDIAEISAVAPSLPGSRLPRLRGTWTCAILGNVGAKMLDSAAVQARASGFSLQGWRSLERRSPIAGLPFVLMERDGPCDAALLAFLARSANSYAAAMEVRQDGEPTAWWMDPESDGEPAAENGVIDVIGLIHHLAVTMGEAAGLLRWPRHRTGQALG